MNERLKELAEQAEAQYCDLGDASCFKRLGLVEAVVFKPKDLEKFAELIVRECINQAHSVGDLRGANDDMIYGADTAAVKISKHFGVEE